jgi:TPP-dependent pyruvate/acetoin dehydrogenase alpha subunit
VSEVVTGAVETIRAGGGPRLVECETYRYQEHVGIGCDHDVGYRSRADLEAWQRRDPLLLDRELVDRLDPEIRREIDDAAAFAEASPWPGPDELLADVA